MPGAGEKLVELVVGGTLTRGPVLELELLPRVGPPSVAEYGGGEPSGRSVSFTLLSMVGLEPIINRGRYSIRGQSNGRRWAPEKRAQQTLRAQEEPPARECLDSMVPRTGSTASTNEWIEMIITKQEGKASCVKNSFETLFLTWQRATTRSQSQRATPTRLFSWRYHSTNTSP